MTLILSLLILLILLLTGILLVVLVRQRTPKNDAALVLVQQQLNELSKLLHAQLQDTAKSVQFQFSESAKIIREVTEKLAKVEATNREVVTFAEQLQSLHNILKNPKQRGVLGEYYLKTVLENVLPPSTYQLQYQFQDGTIVDAMVTTKEGIVPIDSKFSLENYNRFLEAATKEERQRYEAAFLQDVKLRIEETAKYIKPQEGTLQFAFMFIPSEAVYYDLLVNKIGSMKSSNMNIIEYAWKKGVIIVSPTTFLAYLQTVLHGLRALRIEESAKAIRKRVEDLGRHLANYHAFMQKLGNHLGTTVNMYHRAAKEFAKIDKDVLKITGTAGGNEPLSLPEHPDRWEQGQE
ncbi:DNA recombination protein RmuC [Candidatus Parcubacteria bacterium]|nr:MAG: DNA recombination protein RmuC [Candidatus Parcubacteria bacterium]